MLLTRILLILFDDERHYAHFVECPGSMMASSMWLAIITTN
jgi:hypothetical protein